MLSREGKQVPPVDAPIREAIGQPMCSACTHCLDLCRGIYRRKDAEGRFMVWVQAVHDELRVMKLPRTASESPMAYMTRLDGLHRLDDARWNGAMARADEVRHPDYRRDTPPRLRLPPSRDFH